jgi:hypothetical protein
MQNDEVRVSFVLDQATADALDRAAALNDRSRSAHLRRLLRQGLGLEAPEGWTPTVTTSSMSGVAGNLDVEASVLVPPADPTICPVTGTVHRRGGPSSTASGLFRCKDCDRRQINGVWQAEEAS